MLLAMSTPASAVNFHVPKSYHPESPYAVRLIELTNTARTSEGLKPLRECWDNIVAARSWALHMRRYGLAHNPAALSAIPSAFQVEENVGWGYVGPEVIFAAYMASPTHRDHLLDPGMVCIGVGVAYPYDVIEESA